MDKEFELKKIDPENYITQKKLNAQQNPNESFEI